MKQVKLLLILSVAVIALFLAACGGDSNNSSDLPTSYDDITHSVADWVIMFGNSSDLSKTPHMVFVYWTGDMAGLSETDTAELTFGGQSVNLETFFGMPGMYFAAIEATEGQTYNVEYKYNGVTKVSTDLKMAYACTGTFPNTFNPAESATFNWTVSNNNQYQIAGGYATLESQTGDDDQEMDSFVEIPATDRTFTLGANKLTNFGTGTYYGLEIDQLNYKVVSKVALMSIAGDMAEYGYATKQDQALSMRTRAINIYKHMQNR